MKKEIVLMFLILLLASSSGFQCYGETKAVEAQKKMEAAIKVEEKAQKKADSWTAKKERILAEIQDLKHRGEWLKFQQIKYKNYIGKEEEILEELERKRKKFDEIQMKLEPYLAEVLVSLKRFVKNDLQFLRDERQKRLAFLDESFNDYRVGMGEKLRRILEALQVEANYGRSIEKTEGVLKINGEVIQVNLFRIGRLALYYQSLDGKQIGFLDKTTEKWKVLPSRYEREITQAMEMAERRRSMDLVDLPVGTWQN